jgi:hypothetical protein
MLDIVVFLWTVSFAACDISDYAADIERSTRPRSNDVTHLELFVRQTM